jgi:hypothetical protein
MGGPSTKVMSETQLLDSQETQIPSISQFRGCQPASASEWKTLEWETGHGWVPPSRTVEA